MASIIGLDVGTSGTKAVLFSVGRGVTARSRVAYPLSYPRPMWVEQNPAHWLDATITCLRELGQSSAFDAKEVVAVGLTGQMHTAALLDKAGKPVRPAISWMDTRSLSQVVELSEGVLAHKLQLETLNSPSPLFTLPQLLWVKEKEPEVWALVRRVLIAKDYVAWALCGEAATDPSDASGTLLYSAREGRWMLEIARELGIQPEVLPPIVPSGTVVGYLREELARATGLPAKIPVVLGAADLSAEVWAVEQTASTSPMAILRLGTAGVAAATRPLKDPAAHHRGTAYAAIQPGHMVISVGTQTCCAALDWTTECLGAVRSSGQRVSLPELESIAMEAPPGCAGVMFYPYLAGDRGAEQKQSLHGTCLGITTAHQLSHLVRAVFEGVAFSVYQALQRLLGEEPPRDGAVAVIGGGTRSAILTQALAGLVPGALYTSAAEPALGAALLAARATVVTVGCQLPEEIRVLLPDTERRVYRAAYAHWVERVPLLGAVYGRN